MNNLRCSQCLENTPPSPVESTAHKRNCLMVRGSSCISLLPKLPGATAGTLRQFSAELILTPANCILWTPDKVVLRLHYEEGSVTPLASSSSLREDGTLQDNTPLLDEPWLANFPSEAHPLTLVPWFGICLLYPLPQLHNHLVESGQQVCLLVHVLEESQLNAFTWAHTAVVSDPDSLARFELPGSSCENFLVSVSVMCCRGGCTGDLGSMFQRKCHWSQDRKDEKLTRSGVGDGVDMGHFRGDQVRDPKRRGLVSTRRGEIQCVWHNEPKGPTVI